MSLKIIKSDGWRFRIVLVLAAFMCLTATWFFVRWNFASAVIARIDAVAAEGKKPVAEWATQLAPDDPNAHFATAVILEGTFEAGDLENSLKEYEAATARSPYHYVLWLKLAKARNIAGDVEGSEVAFRRALELAPNYSTVQWAYGNFLIRQDRAGEGFALIAKAAAADPKYSSPAVVMAMQIFDGDLTQVTQLLGDNESTNAAVAGVLGGQGRIDEAYAAWSKIPDDMRLTKFKELGEKLLDQAADAKKFQIAAHIATETRDNMTERPSIGAVLNGGFEHGVKLRKAGLFEWQIAEGAEPQVGLSDGKPHGGSHSLFMVFNTFATAGFRPMEQTVAVTGGGQYEFEFFYRSDLKTASVLRWEIVDAATLATLAATPPMQPSPDWTMLKTVFTVPPTSDGITLRLARTGCTGPTCPISGRVFFDDFSLRKL